MQRGVSGRVVPASRNIASMLDPATALSIRRLDLQLNVDWVELSDSQVTEVMTSLGVVRSAVPPWAGLMNLPVRFGIAPVEWKSVSSSSFAWPQHIWLSARAFASPEVLAEQLVHEISHQWLYLIEELTPLQIDQTDVRVTLPSGTPNRSVSELLGALHVSLNLRRLWLAIHVDESLRQRRLAHLDMYLDGCLRLLREVEPALTGVGNDFAIRIRQGADAR